MNIELDRNELRQIYFTLLAAKFMSEKSSEVLEFEAVNKLLHQISETASNPLDVEFYARYRKQTFSSEFLTQELWQKLSKLKRTLNLQTTELAHSVSYPYKVDDAVLELFEAKIG